MIFNLILLIWIYFLEVSLLWLDIVLIWFRCYICLWCCWFLFSVHFLLVNVLNFVIIIFVYLLVLSIFEVFYYAYLLSFVYLIFSFSFFLFFAWMAGIALVFTYWMKISVILNSVWWFEWSPWTIPFLLCCAGYKRWLMLRTFNLLLSTTELEWSRLVNLLLELEFSASANWQLNVFYL